MCWLIIIPVQLCLFQPHGLTPTTLSYTILLNIDAANTYVQIYTNGTMSNNMNVYDDSYMLCDMCVRTPTDVDTMCVILYNTIYV